MRETHLDPFYKQVNAETLCGKFLGKERKEWMQGGFFLVSHSDETSPMGKGIGLAVMGYDPNDKVYTYRAFNSMGDAEDAKGTFDDGTWTWTSDSKMGGKVMKGRFTVKETSPTSYTFKYEMSSDGGEWSSVMEGNGTKAK